MWIGGTLSSHCALILIADSRLRILTFSSGQHICSKSQCYFYLSPLAQNGNRRFFIPNVPRSFSIAQIYRHLASFKKCYCGQSLSMRLKNTQTQLLAVYKVPKHVDSYTFFPLACAWFARVPPCKISGLSCGHRSNFETPRAKPTNLQGWLIFLMVLSCRKPRKYSPFFSKINGDLSPPPSFSRFLTHSGVYGFHIDTICLKMHLKGGLSDFRHEFATLLELFCCLDIFKPSGVFAYALYVPSDPTAFVCARMYEGVAYRSESLRISHIHVSFFAPDVSREPSLPRATCTPPCSIRRLGLRYGSHGSLLILPSMIFFSSVRFLKKSIAIAGLFDFLYLFEISLLFQWPSFLASIFSHFR